MVLKLRRLAMYVGVIAIVGILAFALVIPSGVSSKAPQATIEVTITDLGTGGTIKAAAVVGEPTNTASVYKPVINFKPLSTFEQTVDVFADHEYSISVKTIYKYSGTNIQSFENVTVYIFAQKSINGAENNMWNNEIIQKVTKAGSGDATKMPYRLNFFYVGNDILTSDPMTQGTTTIGMNPSDPFTKLAPTSKASVGVSSPIFIGGSINSLLKPITGADLNGWTIHCKIFVGGVDMAGNFIIGMVEATLVLHANVTLAGGSISLSIDGMSANIG